MKGMKSAQGIFLTIKLGRECNLKCLHCHDRCGGEYELTQQTLDWISSQNVRILRFVGGEPFLYFDAIKRIVGCLHTDPVIRIVTNGTLLTKEQIAFINERNIQIIVSYDGKESARDASIPIRWDLVSQCRNKGIASHASLSNDVAKVNRDIRELSQKNNLGIVNDCFVRFVHETGKTGSLKSKAEIQAYIASMKETIESQLVAFVELSDNRIKTSFGFVTLFSAIEEWLEPKEFHGTACCNPTRMTITPDGRIMSCTYGTEYCGTVTKGIDTTKLDKMIHAKCGNCRLLRVCKTSCIDNITRNECVIALSMNRFLIELGKKHGADLIFLLNQWRKS